MSSTGKIHNSCVIYENVRIGENVSIGAYCVIGSPPESKKYFNQDNKNNVIINDGVVIHGLVTIDKGTIKDTVIGRDVWLMKGVHVGHDVEIGDGCIISPHSCIGGHVKIGANTNIGMGAIIHQRLTIPPNCMIGMGSVITKKTVMRNGYVYAGNPAKELRENIR